MADVTPWAPVLDRHQRILGRMPYLAAVDPHPPGVSIGVLTDSANMLHKNTAHRPLH